MALSLINTLFNLCMHVCISYKTYKQLFWSLQNVTVCYVYYFSQSGNPEHIIGL